MTERWTSRLLLLAGLVTWALMAAGSVIQQGHHVTMTRHVTEVALWLAFAAGFLFVAWPRGETSPRVRSEVVALTAQTAAVLALTAMGRGTFAGVLLAVIAGQLGLTLPMRLSALWLAAQTVGFFLALASNVSTRGASLTSAGYFGFQLFAIAAADLTRREREARRELHRVNSELRATQSLLAESTRAAERLRIARELHDALGHHLTALALQLEVAKNTAQGNEAVLRAQEISRGLLQQVRSAVSAIRDEARTDLREALRLLAQGFAGPKIHLMLADELRELDPAVAHAVFRFVQEALTNAGRHSAAQNVRVTVSATATELKAEVADDGRGAAQLTGGQGMLGMRERIEAVGGTVQVETAIGKGVTVRAVVPLRGVAP